MYQTEEQSTMMKFNVHRTGVPEFDTREDHASNQTYSQVLRFVWQNTFLGGKDFCFFCLRQIFPGTTKFGKTQQIQRALPPNPPRGYGPALYTKIYIQVMILPRVK